MAGWADDPELLATFRAEVEERVAALQSGLLALEQHPSPRQVITGLFRDAHTIKGSARMLGLTGVLQVAHRSEDVLGAMRDGRLSISRDLIDLLLAGCDAILGALPGVADPVPDSYLVELAEALERTSAGDPAVAPARPGPAEVADDVVDDIVPRAGDSMRIATAKVYDLLDAIGEAELAARRITSSAAAVGVLTDDTGWWLRQLREDGSGVSDGEVVARLVAIDDQLSAASRELRELADDARVRLDQVRDGAMGLAMVPVRRVVAGLPRVVRDVAAAAGKDIRLVLAGEDVELDKQVLDGVSDALKHLVVNAVDHGCETPAARIPAGKPAQATVSVTARVGGGTVVIDVTDDGAGIDDDIVRRAAIGRGLLLPDSTLTGPMLHEVLFRPAFSTASSVTETSGRGVGLDAVRNAVEGLGGSLALRTTPGVGTTFAMTLPVTLGVLRCLMARLGEQCYAIPLPGVVELLSLKDASIHSLAGTNVVVSRDATVPLLDLAVALGLPAARKPAVAVVVRHAEKQVAWAVDSVDGERELIVKGLGDFLGRPPAVSGATIDGDGRVVCVLDLRELADGSGPVPPGGSSSQPAQAPPRPRVLIVEDSVGVRELERAILAAAGYDVITAVDGTEGAARLQDDPADLVLSDVEMPGMDGFALTRTIRRTKGWEQVPVVIMTSRGDEADQRAGLEAGASAYLLKSEFDQNQLVETVRRLVGR